MKLEVGKYVRFDNVICQIEEVEEDWLCFDIGFYNHWNELTYSMKYKEFVEEYKPKFSNNLIDLIETGDYVNGDRITQIASDYVEVCYGRDSYDFIKKENIKSIVTKEQFESMSYRVGR